MALDGATSPDRIKLACARGGLANGRDE